jgi:hypothetical protein
MQLSSATGLTVEAPFAIRDEFATNSFHVYVLPPGCMYEINIAAHGSSLLLFPFLLLSPWLAVDCKRSLCLVQWLGPEKRFCVAN